MIETEFKKRALSLQRGIETATGESYNDLTEAVKGSIDRYNNKPWYDFTIELTSDTSIASELLTALRPYFSELRVVKDFAFLALEESNIQYSDQPNTPLACVVYNTNTGVYGFVSRFRGPTQISSITFDSSACIAYAGQKFRVKVVSVLV